jgi:hypothetical protein
MSILFANGFLQSSTPATLQTFDAQGFAVRKKCLKFLTRSAERRLHIIRGPSRKIKCQQCLRSKFAQSLQPHLAQLPQFEAVGVRRLVTALGVEEGRNGDPKRSKAATSRRTPKRRIPA